MDTLKCKDCDRIITDPELTGPLLICAGWRWIDLVDGRDICNGWRCPLCVVGWQIVVNEQRGRYH